MLIVGGKYLYFIVAKHTFLQPFYSKVEVAKEQAKPLRLNNYLGQDESSLAPSFWGQLWVRGAYLGDCLRVHYTSGDMSGRHVYKCEKGFNTYYGLFESEPQVLEAAHNELKVRGWNLTAQDGNSIEAALLNYTQNKPIYLTYSNSHNLWASIAIYSLPQPARCNGGKACMFAQRDIVKPYDLLLVFTTTAENP